MSNASSREGLCRRCGCCCFEKYDIEGRIYYTDVPCEFLDLRTRHCTVYAQRQKRKKGCVKITPRIASMGVLPKDCPYVKGQTDYVAPVPFAELAEQGG